MRLLTSLLLSVVCAAHAGAQQQVNIHTRGNIVTFPVEDVDSVTFPLMSSDELEKAKAGKYSAYIAGVDELLAVRDDNTNIYNDFGKNADVRDISQMITQSGHTIRVTGLGAHDTGLKDGKTYNNKNYYIYVPGEKPLNYIGMSFSYSQVDDDEATMDAVPPCVVMFAKKEETWTHILHVMFYRDNVAINTRDGGDFRYDCERLGGHGRYATKDYGDVYSVSLRLEGDTMFIRKPDGEYLTMRNDYFRDAFPVAIWQVFNKPEYKCRGYIHEIFAGTSPYVDAAYKLADRFRTSLK
jgi:hypothetical protein